jgi:hypothetical protein
MCHTKSAIKISSQLYSQSDILTLIRLSTNTYLEGKITVLLKLQICYFSSYENNHDKSD